MSFGLLWELTLGSWLTAALILLTRLLFGRWLSAKAKYALWLLLVLRLLPLPLRSPTSLLRYTPETLRAEAVEAYVAPAAERFTELAIREREEEPMADSVPDSPWVTIRRLWLLGAGAVLLVYAVMYITAAGRLNSLPPCEDPDTLREYLRLKQACHPGFNPRLVMGDQGLLGGFLRPVMVIPVELRGEGAAPILLHELMHYKFWDVWLGLLFRLLCAAYWFNPGVWFCFWLLRRDGELACDQRVLDTGLVSPRVYAKALMEEYQRCGESDPMPLTHWGTRGMMKRISDILGYQRRNPREWILPMVLGVLILAFGVVSPWQSRALALYGHRSILAEVGCPDTDTYVEALRRTPLGSFGSTWSQLVEGGYLTEDEGSWSDFGPEKRVYTVTRMIAGAERTVRYVFRTTLYTEAEGKLVLTEICAAYPYYTDEYEYDQLVRAEGGALLESWPALEKCFEMYNGSYYRLLRADEVRGWEFLYWEKRPEDLDEDVRAAMANGNRFYYHIRTSPVTLADCLNKQERSALADLAVEKGWAENRQEGLRFMGNWHLAGLVDDVHGMQSEEGRFYSWWTLNGMGLALYVTRPRTG